MSDADAHIGKLTADLANIQEEWRNFAVRPFSIAYSTACKKFKETIKAQEEADKAEGEWKLALGMFALSLCGGGIMTAAFGTTVLKNIIVDRTVNAICNRNMDKAFRVAHFISQNKTANYIAGRVWDEVESRTTDHFGGKLREELAQNRASYPSVSAFMQDPLDMYLALDGFIGEARTKLYRVIATIRDSKLPDGAKIALVNMIRQTSRFWNSPKGSVDNGSLSEDIELSFYMHLLMESDYTWEQGLHCDLDGRWGVRDNCTRSGYKYKRDITESVHSQRYPSLDKVRYKGMGRLVRTRINDLAKRKLGIVFTGMDNLWHSDLIHAERALDQLASMNIQRLIASV